MLFTLRENRSFGIAVGIWALLTALCTVAGPFGTFEALPMLSRFIYWAGVVGFSVALSFGLQWARPYFGPRGRWGLQGLFVLVIAGGNHLLNAFLFTDWGGWAQFFYLLSIVAVVVFVVHGAVMLFRPVSQMDVAHSDAEVLFLRRLPLEKRGPLIRIEAQDHYLEVVTESGKATILLRLGEAIDALAGVDGIQVHRSHWVKTDAVQGHRREKGRDFLTMKDGGIVPVSRSFRAIAQQAGLF